MPLSDQEMTHLARLARLELSPDERERLKDDLGEILAYFEQLRALDTDDVAELARPIETENVFREDGVLPPLPHLEAMKLAVASEDGFFRVPRTVDADG